jgi:hypothetical protein
MYQSHYFVRLLWRVSTTYLALFNSNLHRKRRHRHGNHGQLSIALALIYKSSEFGRILTAMSLATSLPRAKPRDCTPEAAMALAKRN